MDYRVNESEYRFMMVLWETEPIGSSELVKQCLERLGWKKSTTYTVIKRLSEKKIVENRDAVVISLVSKEQIDRQESEQVLAQKFHGSVPEFLATFLKGRSLTAEEVNEIKALIEDLSDE